jgi:voltage-gated potassium channel
MKANFAIFVAILLFFLEVILIVYAGYPIQVAVYETLISLFSLPSVVPEQSFYLNPIVAIAIILGGISSIFVFGFIIGATVEALQEVRISFSQNLKDHAIVCGYGTTGKYVINFLKKIGIRYVIIEKDPIKVRSLLDIDEKVVEGDASKKEILEEAGIKKARFLICCLNNDSSTLFTVVMARALNKNLYISAKIKDEKFKEILINAGANFVTKPETNGGRELAKKVISVI